MQPITSYPRIVCSISGGRTSAYLAYQLKHDPRLAAAHILYIFADTGKELPETITFLRACDTAWGLGVIGLHAVVSPIPRVGTGYETFDIHARHGNDTTAFEVMIKKYGLPNMSRPHCTRTLKIEPINRYARDVFGTKDYVTAVGIRADEPKRVGTSGAFNKVYPLVTDYPASIETVDTFFKDTTKPQLTLKSWEGNCDFCWKKADVKLKRIAEDRPHVVQWWRDMEGQYGGPEDYTFFRRNRSVDDVLFDARHEDTSVLDAPYKLDLSNPANIGGHCDCA